MKKITQKLSVILGILSLVSLITPSFLYLGNKMSHEQVKWVMFGATILWFLSTTVWFVERE